MEELLDQIRDIIESHESLIEHNNGKEHCVLRENYDDLADDIFNLVNKRS